MFTRLRRFLRELKRRNVYRVAVAYLVAAFVAVQAADLLVPETTLPAGAETTVIYLAVAGLPIALVVAWAFELTPEGVRRTPESEEGTGGPHLVSDGPSNSEPRAGDRSIAVLPFRALGQDVPSTFGEGMHDALLTRLSNLSSLKVISRTSVQQYRQTEKTTSEIARELGVKWVVEGGVQEIGDQIQVNAQLIDPRSDTHRWAESYRRELTAEDLFQLQSDLTMRIARSLEAELTPSVERRVVRRPTESLDAYRLYVKGRQHLARWSYDVQPAETVREGIECFRQAIEQDSGFALAWAGLADASATHRRMLSWAQMAVDRDEVRRIGVSEDNLSELPEPEEAARRALNLDPELAEAHASMGFLHLQQMDAPGALRALELAIDVQPSYWEAHHWLGELYLKIGRPDEALDHVSLAVELNPRHALARHWLYDTYLITGQAEESLREARRQQQMGLERMTAVMGEVRALVVLDRLSEARRVAEAEISQLGVETIWGGWFRAYLAQIHAAEGDEAVGRENLRELEAADADKSMVAWAQAGLGQMDEAIRTYRELERGSWGRIGTVAAFRYPTAMGLPDLRDHPDYRELLCVVNEYWGLNPEGSLPDSVDLSFGG